MSTRWHKCQVGQWHLGQVALVTVEQKSRHPCLVCAISCCMKCFTSLFLLAFVSDGKDMRVACTACGCFAGKRIPLGPSGCQVSSFGLDKVGFFH